MKPSQDKPPQKDSMKKPSPKLMQMIREVEMAERDAIQSEGGAGEGTEKGQSTKRRRRAPVETPVSWATFSCVLGSRSSRLSCDNSPVSFSKKSPPSSLGCSLAASLRFRSASLIRVGDGQGASIATSKRLPGPPYRGASCCCGSARKCPKNGAPIKPKSPTLLRIELSPFSFSCDLLPGPHPGIPSKMSLEPIARGQPGAGSIYPGAPHEQGNVNHWVDF